MPCSNLCGGIIILACIHDVLFCTFFLPHRSVVELWIGQNEQTAFALCVCVCKMLTIAISLRNMIISQTKIELKCSVISLSLPLTFTSLFHFISQFCGWQQQARTQRLIDLYNLLNFSVPPTQKWQKEWEEKTGVYNSLLLAHWSTLNETKAESIKLECVRLCASVWIRIWWVLH